jgi:hypothetical protein
MRLIKIILLSTIIFTTPNCAEAQNQAEVKSFESAIHPDFIQKEETKIPADSTTVVKSDKVKTRPKRLAIAAAVYISLSTISTLILINVLENAIDNSNNKTIHFTI